MLMLPEPRRDFRDVGSSEPVCLYRKYVLTKIGLAPESEFDGLSDQVTIEPSFIELENAMAVEFIGVETRWARIRRIYEGADDLPPDLCSRVRAHQELMEAGDSIDADLVRSVREIQACLGRLFGGDTGQRDPVPALERYLKIPSVEAPSLPSPDVIADEERLVKARSACEWRLAKARGAESREFSRMVREAYRHTCLFCGALLGNLKGVASGVDAAHILAWSRYELDAVQNGLCLCKLHHWAFDAALQIPVFLDSGELVTRFTELAIEELDSNSLQVLGVHDAIIPAHRLPSDRTTWPDPDYLRILYADLNISFAP